MIPPSIQCFKLIFSSIYSSFSLSYDLSQSSSFRMIAVTVPIDRSPVKVTFRILELNPCTYEDPTLKN